MIWGQVCSAVCVCVFIRVLSYIQCLVSLNQTLVHFPLWCGYSVLVRTQPSGLGADQNAWAETISVKRAQYSFNRARYDFSNKAIWSWIGPNTGSESNMMCVLGCEPRATNWAKGQNCGNAMCSKDFDWQTKEVKKCWMWCTTRQHVMTYRATINHSTNLWLLESVKLKEMIHNYYQAV